MHVYYVYMYTCLQDARSLACILCEVSELDALWGLGERCRRLERDGTGGPR